MQPSAVTSDIARSRRSFRRFSTDWRHWRGSMPFGIPRGCRIGVWTFMTLPREREGVDVERSLFNIDDAADEILSGELHCSPCRRCQHGHLNVGHGIEDLVALIWHVVIYRRVQVLPLAQEAYGAIVDGSASCAAGRVEAAPVAAPMAGTKASAPSRARRENLPMIGITSAAGIASPAAGTWVFGMIAPVAI
jgi:hypothetical protein